MSSPSPETTRLARERRSKLLVGLALGGSLLLVVAVVVLVVRGCSKTVAELDVDEQRRETSFVLDRPQTVGFSARLELSETPFRNRDDIPHVVDYEIRLLRGETVVADLICNPFEMFVWSSGSASQRLVYLRGKLQGCSAKLGEPGPYRVRVRRVWTGADRPFRLERATLGVEIER